MENTYSPVLDYDMITLNQDLFSMLPCYKKALSEYKKKSQGFCGNCLGGFQNEFAQKIRNDLFENKRKDIFSKLDPKTIVRYGRKIYRAGDLI